MYLCLQQQHQQQQQLALQILHSQQPAHLDSILGKRRSSSADRLEEEEEDHGPFETKEEEERGGAGGEDEDDCDEDEAGQECVLPQSTLHYHLPATMDRQYMRRCTH
jgi:hypothetical protein